MAEIFEEEEFDKNRVHIVNVTPGSAGHCIELGWFRCSFTTLALEDIPTVMELIRNVAETCKSPGWKTQVFALNFVLWIVDGKSMYPNHLFQWRSKQWKRSKKWTSIVVTPSFDDNNPDVVTDETTSTATAVASTSKVKNGCECCNKKVGLMGFECHCGSTFCGVHRYPKEHSCTFDFKTLDLQHLAKQNPLVAGPEPSRSQIRVVGSLALQRRRICVQSVTETVKEEESVAAETA
ncbi:hypothetical protein POTOM_042457 [Populus tomentosa]|uniref:AN1-type domain-containing protein n=1 Tax=Populus tomentosa TaxID=118781 RepID=A0A8X7YJK4_POPTO|nr:hypothetical protein POTOM_042457 [Populus tomentosa]